MKLTARSVLLVIAVVVFIAVALGFEPLKGIDLTAVGLAFFAGAFLVP